ncbi:hypothetical protein ACJX0J_036875, partial [Zea mays]
LVPTDYEKIRAMNMMKNNQLFQRLGLGQLKSLVTATAANNKEDCPQQSESLYDGENTDNSNEEESQCTNGGCANISNDGDQISTKVTRGNKIIVAPTEERTIRVTRQRIAKVNQENSHNLSIHKQLSSCPATNHDSIETLVDSCMKNKLNREKVQYQQCIGSQSYIAKAYLLKEEKYKDAEPSAIDLFKDMHCSKKKGFSENVKKAI